MKTFLTIFIAFFLVISSVFAQQSIFDLVNLKNGNLADITAYEKIKIIDAWNFIESSTPIISNVEIGLIDTGVDISHQEFINVRVASDIVVDKQPGGHGTQVIGIIGANNRSFSQVYISPQMNGVVSGVRSLNYRINAKSLQNLATEKNLTMAEVIGEMDKMLRLPTGLDIFNGSFNRPLCGVLRSGLNIDCYSSAKDFLDHKARLEALFSKYPTSTFVFSAGNWAADAQFTLPAAINVSNTIIVGATDLNDGRAKFNSLEESNFGSSVNISAPGENIYAPKPGNTYEVSPGFNGTSAAAPLVTGVAAILKSIKPELTPAEIKDILIKSPDPLFVSSTNDEADKLLGFGCSGVSPTGQVLRGCRLNALKAVQALFPKLPIRFSEKSGIFFGGAVI